MAFIRKACLSWGKRESFAQKKTGPFLEPGRARCDTRWAIKARIPSLLLFLNLMNIYWNLGTHKAI